MTRANFLTAFSHGAHIPPNLKFRRGGNGNKVDKAIEAVLFSSDLQNPGEVVLYIIELARGKDDELYKKEVERFAATITCNRQEVMEMLDKATYTIEGNNIPAIVGRIQEVIIAIGDSRLQK